MVTKTFSEVIAVKFVHHKFETNVYSTYTNTTINSECTAYIYEHPAYEANRVSLLWGVHKTQYFTCISLMFGGGGDTCTHQFHVVYILSVHKFGWIRSHFEHSKKVHFSFNKTRGKHVFSHVRVCFILFSLARQLRNPLSISMNMVNTGQAPKVKK
jgi:hypothetical protein